MSFFHCSSYTDSYIRNSIRRSCSPQQPGITCAKKSQASGNIAVTLSRVFVKDLPFTLQVSRPIIKPSWTFAQPSTSRLSTWMTHCIHRLRCQPPSPRQITRLQARKEEEKVRQMEELEALRLIEEQRLANKKKNNKARK